MVETLDESEQESLLFSIELLRNLGPALGRPHADSISGSRHANMKELRTQHAGRPYRTLFAFDPNRAAILLVAGEKTGEDRFYKRLIPIADRLLDEHLAAIKSQQSASKKSQPKGRRSHE